MERTPPSLEDQHRLRFLRTLATYVPAMGIVAGLGYLVIFLITGAWQMLAAAVLAIIGSALFVSTRMLLNRGRTWAAAFLMMLLGAALLAAYGLFWSGMTWLLILGVWAIPMTIAWFGVARNFRLAIVPLVAIGATAALAIIDRYQPIARLAINDVNILRWLIPLIVTLGGALLFLVVIRGIVTGHLANRLLPAFLLIVLIPIVTLSASSILSSQDSDRRYAANNLDGILNQKEGDINNWTEALKNDLGLVDLTTVGHMVNLATLAPGGDPEPDHAQAVAGLRQLLSQTGRFAEIFLMNKDGTVLAGTQSSSEGQNYLYQEFFWQGRRGMFINPPTYFQPAGEVSIFVSRPITDPTGATVGVLAGRANLLSVQHFLSQQTNPDIKIYLVDSNYSSLNTVTIGRPTLSVNSPGTAQAIDTAQNGFALYTNHLNVPVIGVYHWLPTLKVVLLAEIPQVVAFSNLRTIIVSSLIIALVSASVAVLGALYTLQTLNTPLTNLADVARQVAGGDLSQRAKVEQEDEIATVANAFNDMTGQMQTLITNLEGRVAERTQALEMRSHELQTAAQIARDASLEQNTSDLLDRVARLIRERLGFYHVGIFLIDDSREYAVLSAAGGEAGQLMLANRHKLKVGQVGIVGFVAQTGEPRIALDVGADAVHFRNPLLPYTRSEMALPLKTSERIVGVLDVQSDKVNAFNQDDISIMQILTDQLGVSIERTRLLQELKQNAAEMEKSYQEYTSRAWRSFLHETGKIPGYRFAGSVIEPISQASPESLEALTKGTSLVIQGSEEKAGSTLAVPVRIRGMTIGTLNLRFHGQEVSPETIRLVEEAASRLALALENARLVQDVQRLALRERQINVISTQVQQSVDLETVLQNTIRELGNALNVPRTFIQIGLMPSEEKGNEKK